MTCHRDSLGRSIDERGRPQHPVPDRPTIEWDGAESREQDGPPCLFQRLMAGPWSSHDRRRYETWNWRWQDRHFEVHETAWREGSTPIRVEFTDLVREWARQEIVVLHTTKFDPAPRLVRRTI